MQQPTEVRIGLPAQEQPSAYRSAVEELLHMQQAIQKDLQEATKEGNVEDQLLFIEELDMIEAALPVPNVMVKYSYTPPKHEENWIEYF